jgi:hypothetical protein
MSEFEQVLPEVIKGLKLTHGDEFSYEITLQLNRIIESRKLNQKSQVSAVKLFF